MSHVVQASIAAGAEKMSDGELHGRRRSTALCCQRRNVKSIAAALVVHSAVEKASELIDRQAPVLELLK
jgi:hypothetical protein